MAILVIFRYFFCIFGAQPGMRDFVFFSVFFRISGLEGFSYSVVPQILDMFCTFLPIRHCFFLAAALPMCACYQADTLGMGGESCPPLQVLLASMPCDCWCKGGTRKGDMEKHPESQEFRVFSGSFLGVFRVFSGIVRVSSGCFQVFSGCFQGVFPCPLCGYHLWTLPRLWRPHA